MSEPYIIAFTQGSSGRFVKYLLYSLLTGSLNELEVCPITNSTHKSDDRVYTGYSETGSNSRPGIWNIIKFDDPLQEPDAPRIFATHRFPDFELIRERLGTDVKIIIVTINEDDLKEIVVNDKVKNYFDILTGKSRDVLNPATVPELIKRYERYLGKKYPGTYVKEDIIAIGKKLATDNIQYLFYKKLMKGRVKLNIVEDTDFETRIGKYMNLSDNLDYPMDQLLFLPYSELTTKIDDEYVWLKKLEDFTGKKASDVIKESYQNYINGRDELLKSYRL